MAKAATVERTLILLKPDAVGRGLVGEIISRFERKGLELAGLKLMSLDKAAAKEHYAEHEGKPFFDGLVDFVTQGPLVAAVTIEAVRPMFEALAVRRFKIVIVEVGVRQ